MAKSKHTHNWGTAFTEMKDGETVKSYLHCRTHDCDLEGESLGVGWKVVNGKFEKETENTWASSAAHITR